MAIPIMNPRAQYDHLMDQIQQQLMSVVDSGAFILGEHVKGLERELASYLGVEHAIGVANGTDALVLALRALEIGPGDEVICPAYTFYATAEAIAAVGATPVFAEVDDTCTLDVDAVRAALTGRTKAIMPVHLFGHMAPMAALKALADEHGLAIVEDSAQAIGATLDGKHCGSWGDAATFSFFPTKNMGGFGDGGAVVTRRSDLDDAIRQLRFHGSRDKVVFTEIGYNSRLDELQACVLRLFLNEIDGWNARRREVAAWYDEAGLGELVRLPIAAPGVEHIHHLYMVRSTERDAIITACKERGIGAAVYYGIPMHLQPVFAHLGYGAGDLPVTEQLAAEGVALPMFPTMTQSQVTEVVEAVRAAVPAGVHG